MMAKKGEVVLVIDLRDGQKKKAVVMALTRKVSKEGVTGVMVQFEDGYQQKVANTFVNW